MRRRLLAGSRVRRSGASPRRSSTWPLPTSMAMAWRKIARKRFAGCPEPQSSVTPPRHLVKAFAWIDLAAQSGEKSYVEMRDVMATSPHTTARLREEGRALSRRLQERFAKHVQ